MKKCEGKVGVCVDDQTGADVQDQRGGGVGGKGDESVLFSL